MPDIYDFIKELASFELEYVDDRDNYHCVNSYIKRVEDDYILIAPPQKGNMVHNIPDGTEINIIFKTETGMYSAVSSVMGKQLGEMSGVKISYPYNSQFTERREFIRVPVDFRVEVIRFPDNSYQNPETFYVQTRNISGNGICYISDRPLENYYDVDCKIFIENEQEPVYVKCDHIYSKKIKINNEKAYLTALAFVDISEENLAKLVKTCFKYQIDNRNREKQFFG